MRQCFELLVCLMLIMTSIAGLPAAVAEAEMIGGGSGSQAVASSIAASSNHVSLNDSQLINSRITAEHANAVGPDEKIVYLTFDDGPSKHTEKVLDILRQEEVAATFFVLGEAAERYPELLRRAADEGHSIGNHTFDHRYETIYGRFAAFAEQIIAAEEAIYKAAGVRTNLVRAPGGSYSNFDQGYFDALSEAGYQLHDWNVDSGDSKRRGVPAKEIIANIKESKLPNKVNVLLHDGGGHEETVKALPDIIRYYKGLGYTFAALTEEDEPIQFKAAPKLKWDRPAVTKRETAAFVKRAASARVLLEQELLKRAESEEMKEKEKKGHAVGGVPYLRLQKGADYLQLAPHEYELIDGSIHLSLSKLMNWIGGEVRYDANQAMAVGHLNGENKQWTLDSEQSSMINGDIKVPLRATLKDFDIEIDNYIFNKDQRSVWIKS